MKLNAFCEKMESIAPKELALSFDNVGLLIGPDHDEIRKVLVALDLTVPVAQEAIDGGYDLVLTHHPIFWDPIKSISPDAYETAAAYLLIRHGIGHFAAHTNLDACSGGVNDVLAGLLSLENIRLLPPENLGRIGALSTPMPFSSFATFCETKLGVHGRFAGDPNRMIRTVAVIGGSGGGDVEYVHLAGCDAFVTGEMKHSQALLAEHLGLCCCVMGHYETEFPVLKPLISRLQRDENDVQYDLAHMGCAPLRGL
ncbi:MAG: Nif3-like dinuclear metal center hexameric protein [Clostridia bacterium]|nr:Nif3-like dinuclear metal center hexameric protein [Clostridia bacterium]